MLQQVNGLANEFFTTGDNNWYYIGANGKTVTGEVKLVTILITLLKMVNK